MSPIRVDLPQGTADIHHLVLDFTGTLSLDGTLIPGVAPRLRDLANELQVTVMTADTFGTAREALKDLPVEVEVIQDGGEKGAMVSALASEGVVAIGNGRNDVPMMGEAGLAIAVMGPEGVASELLLAAQVVTGSILDALDLLANPLRLKATLRS